MTLPTIQSKAAPLTVQFNETRKPFAHILIYGRTKGGKTTAANSLEADPLKNWEGHPEQNAIISTQPADQLSHLSPKTPYVVAADFEQLKYAIDNVTTLFPLMKTLIIDDFSEACALHRATIDGGDNKYKPYQEGAVWAGKVLRKLLHQPFNLILTAFERQDSDGTGAESIQWICPDFPNATAAAINAKMDFICRISDFKLRVKEDKTRRIMAGNRWPLSKVSSLKDEVEPNLAKLWALYQDALK